MSTSAINLLKAQDPRYWGELQQFYLAERFQDVRLIAEDKTVVLASRLVLASISSSLKQVLLEENVEEEELRTIVVPGCEGKRLKGFVDCLYAFLVREVNGDTLQTCQDIMDLLGVDFRFGVDSKDYDDDAQCDDFMADSIDVDVKDDLKDMDTNELFEDLSEDKVNETLDSDIDSEQKPVGHRRKKGRPKGRRAKKTEIEEQPDIKVDEEKNIWKNRLKEANVKTSETAEELYQAMKSASDTLSVTFFPSVLDASVHCSTELNEETKFQALVGVRRTEEASRILALPLAWSKVNASEIEKQFELTSSVLKCLFGLSNAQLFYDNNFFKRMRGKESFYESKDGTTKRYTTLSNQSRKDKIKYIVKRRIAGCTEEELDLKLKHKKILEYTMTTPGKEPMVVTDCIDYELELSNSIEIDDIEGLALVCWDTDTGCPFARFVTVKEEEKDTASVDIHKVMFDVWSNGESFGLIPPVQSILKRMEKMYYPMETYKAIHNFRETDPSGEKRKELAGKRELCEDCGKCFPLITAANLSAFKSHKNSHIVNNTKCDCDLKFEDMNIKADHIKLVHLEGYEKCQGCTKVLLSKNMELHVAKHCANVVDGGSSGPLDSLEKKKFFCDVCGKVSKSLLNHTTHMTIHEEHICPHCGLEITSLRSFKTHLRRVHKATFVCRDCGTDYLDQEQLERHVQRCKGYKAAKKPAEPFRCKHCGLGFANSSNMYKHIMKVHRSKRFSCGQCDKQFIFKSELKCHTESVHLRLMKFPCRFECGKAYVDNPSRCHHESKVHGISYSKKMKEEEEKEKQAEPEAKRVKISLF